LRQLSTLIPIAEGASGRVYRTRDSDTGQILAVKRLRRTEPEHVARLRREAAAQQRLDHPNICRVYGIEQDDQGHWQLFMEFVSGSTLARQMKTLSLEQRIKILAKVAEAVHTAHDKGILHRDLKPSNILLRANESGQVVDPVVADFGLARSEDDPVMTTAGEALGTPAYMAPEQAMGAQDQIGPATDVFALGCMLYEALTGKPPFEAPSVSANLQRLLSEDAQHPRKLNRTAPEALSRIALQCLEREPRRRYASALALAEDLQRWQRGQEVHARRYSRLYRWRRRIARHPLTTAAAAIGLITIATLSGWSVWQAQAAAAREAVAATLGETLGDISNRMLIARLAPRHDIGSDREVLGQQLADVSARHGQDQRLADLVNTSLARAYLDIGNVDQAGVHAERAAEMSDSAATRAVRADVLLARYAEAVVPIMELPADRRSDRLERARERYLVPAERLLAALDDTAEAPAASLARLAILERRFDDAESMIERLPAGQAHDYEKELLQAHLSLEKAGSAVDAGRPEQAVEQYDSARDRLHAIARSARSDPRPRQLACRVARESLPIRHQRAESLPASLEALEPLCVELVAVDPGRVASHAARAAAYASLAAAYDRYNKPATARELLREGIAASARGSAIDPDDRTLLEFRSWIFLRMAQLLVDDFEASQSAFEEAATAARRLSELEPENPLGPTLLGWIERDRARQQQIHDRDPEDAFAAAEAALERAIALDPRSILALSEAALTAIFRFYQLRVPNPTAAVERAQQAIALLERALELDPDNVDLLFDQGANYGDLWYFLALKPGLAVDIDRDALLAQALETLARMRELAPGQPGGYTQAIMLQLSQAEALLSSGESPDAVISVAQDLLSEAQAQGVLIDRDIGTWLQTTRVRSSMLRGDGVEAAIQDAWSTIEEVEVDRSDRFDRQLHMLDLIGLEARWRHRSGQPADQEKLDRGSELLDSLLDRDRRVAPVLCQGATVLVYRARAGTAPAAVAEAERRAARLFEECLEKDPPLRAFYESELELLPQPID
jgi:serine/threonine-protein kinase